MMCAAQPCIRVTVPVRVVPDGDGYHGFAPALRGCHVGGLTREETRRNLDEAVYLYLASLVKHQEPLPIGCQVECGIPRSGAISAAISQALPGIDPEDLASEYEQAELSIPVS